MDGFCFDMDGFAWDMKWYAMDVMAGMASDMVTGGCDYIPLSLFAILAI